MKKKDIKVGEAYEVSATLPGRREATLVRGVVVELDGPSGLVIELDTPRGFGQPTLRWPRMQPGQVKRPWADVLAQRAAAEAAHQARMAEERARHEAERETFRAEWGDTIDPIVETLAPYGIVPVQAGMTYNYRHVGDDVQIPTLVLLGDVSFAAWVVANLPDDPAAETLVEAVHQAALSGSSGGYALLPLVRGKGLEPVGHRHNVPFEGAAAIRMIAALAADDDKVAMLAPLAPEKAA
jgi:hypothetical protein